MKKFSVNIGICIDSEPLNHYNCNRFSEPPRLDLEVNDMTENCKRVTISVPKEMQTKIYAVKSTNYADKSDSAMIRDLIMRGLKEADTVKSEKERKTNI